jgi:hypothetical protein
MATYVGQSPPANGNGWDNSSVTLTWDCSDPLSGVVSPTVTQTITTQGAGQSATGVCTDNAGNTASATQGGINIDETPPTIKITAPTKSTYYVNQAVPANYGCVDNLSGVASCTGTVANGTDIDTSSLGAKKFIVNASDLANNAASLVVDYTVTYNICSLFDQTKLNTSGSTVPIKIAVCDATGRDLSTAGVQVTALSLSDLSSGVSGLPVTTSSGANPSSLFRYDPTLGTAGGYIFNLSTKGLAPGTYGLTFSVSNDPLTHIVTFKLG